MEKDIECPYCGEEFDINHDDGFGYEEGVLHKQRCDHCDKTFVFQTSISFYYEPYKADCLNDENHCFKPTHTYPKEFTRMRCEMCCEERDLTDKEKEELGISLPNQGEGSQRSVATKAK